MTLLLPTHRAWLPLAVILLFGGPAFGDGIDVRVGIFNYSPLSHASSRLPDRQVEADKAADGIFVELLENVVAREHWNLTYVPGTIDECLERLRRGAVDLVLAVPFTDELDAEFSITQQTVLSTWAQVYATHGSEIRSLLDLDRLSVGVMRDDPYHGALRMITRGLNIRCDPVELTNYEELLDALVAGWVDVGVVDRLHAVADGHRGAVVRTPVVFCPVELRFAAHGPLAEVLMLAGVKREGRLLAIIAHARTGDPTPWMEEEIVFAGVISDYVAAAFDSEHQRQAETELARLERLRALGEMSAGVSHNLNNILTGILAPAQLIEAMSDDPNVCAEADCIISSAERARDLAHRLHRSTRGSEEMDLNPVDVNQVVREALQAARPRWKDEPEARGRCVELVTELGMVPRILGTRSGLFDAIINLVFNAVDAMRAGGVLTLATRLAGDVVELAVNDTGTGMDETTMKRVFEPFFTTKTDVGTGLGLSTVYATVTSWRGNILVDSTPGEGTRFTLKLPITTGETVAGEGPTPHPTLTGRVLVVDDDEAVRRVLQQWLQGSHEVCVYDAPEPVLAEFVRGRYDVAVIDLGMPTMPGHELAHSLRQADPSLATVLITGWELGPDDPRLCDFDLQMRKPFSGRADFEQRINQAMELHRTRSRPGSVPASLSSVG